MSSRTPLPSVPEILFPTCILFGRENIFHFLIQFLKLSVNLLSELIEQCLHGLTLGAKDFFYPPGLFRCQIVSGLNVFDYSVKRGAGAHRYHPVFHLHKRTAGAYNQTAKQNNQTYYYLHVYLPAAR
jgi:hypothetical protein